ncbi:PilW family protein [Pseudomonas sp. MBLB4123]|uniref:PilW family protein n=1 Tax=Pseudomonas sp. MBLB4123 TaxID=3451557 RepID=UPI003F75072B
MTDPRKLRQLQAGFSIVELMVALVLGLLLMTGIIQVFLSSRQTYAANEAIGRMQENGRFALEFISRSARNAGYVEPIYLGDKPQPIAATSCTGLPGTTPATVCSTEGGGSVSDSIGFVMQPPIIDGKRRDCGGNEVVGNDQLVINHFAIIPATASAPAALGCRAWRYNSATGQWNAGPNLQALVDGIDRLQVLYGIDTSGDSRSANQYVSANRVTNWNRVRSVRIAVLANSIDPVTPPPANNLQYVLLDATPLTLANLGSDNRARQIFTTTIQLKNTD